MEKGYAEEKRRYTKLMKKEADKLVKKYKGKELTEDIIYNKYEIHDTRILIGALTDALLKKKVITRKELEKSLVSAYKNEEMAHRIGK